MKLFVGYDRVEDVNKTVANMPSFDSTSAMLALIAMNTAVIADIMVDEHNQKVEEERHGKN